MELSMLSGNEDHIRQAKLHSWIFIIFCDTKDGNWIEWLPVNIVYGLLYELGLCTVVHHDHLLNKEAKVLNIQRVENEIWKCI